MAVCSPYLLLAGNEYVRGNLRGGATGNQREGKQRARRAGDVFESQQLASFFVLLVCLALEVSGAWGMYGLFLLRLSVVTP